MRIVVTDQFNQNFLEMMNKFINQMPNKHFDEFSKDFENSILTVMKKYDSNAEEWLVGYNVKSFLEER